MVTTDIQDNDKILDSASVPLLSRGQLKCDGTRAETRIHLSAKWTSPFKSAETSVQSTIGSRGLRISGSNAGYTIFRGSVKGTGYPLFCQFPLHFPSCVSPCAITFQLESTTPIKTSVPTVYCVFFWHEKETKAHCLHMMHFILQHITTEMFSFWTYFNIMQNIK